MYTFLHMKMPTFVKFLDGRTHLFETETSTDEESTLRRLIREFMGLSCEQPVHLLREDHMWLCCID